MKKVEFNNTKEIKLLKNIVARFCRNDTGLFSKDTDRVIAKMKLIYKLECETSLIKEFDENELKIIKFTFNHYNIYWEKDYTPVVKHILNKLELKFMELPDKTTFLKNLKTLYTNFKENGSILFEGEEITDEKELWTKILKMPITEELKITTEEISQVITEYAETETRKEMADIFNKLYEICFPDE